MEPLWDVTALFPCFATGKKQERTRAEAVLTLMVHARSPPVPQVSATGPRSRCPDASRMACAMPASSSGAYPFVWKAARQAAMVTGLREGNDLPSSYASS